MKPIVLAAALFVAAPAFGQPDPLPSALADATSAQTPLPDLSSYDATTLRSYCRALYARIAELEAELAAAKAGAVAAPTFAEVEALGVAAREDAAAAEPAGASEGVWTVKIVANVPTETRTAEEQIDAEERKMKAASDRLNAARGALTRAQVLGREKMKSGGTSTLEREDLQSHHVAIQKVERELRGHEVKLRSLNEQIRRANSERIIQAATDDGKPVTVVARGAYFDLGTQLDVGKRYRVAGRGTVGETSGKIVLKSAAPVD